MAIQAIARLTCDKPHPWSDPPTVEIPTDTVVALYVKEWMLVHGWSLDTFHADRVQMLCPACTYRRLQESGYDAVGDDDETRS